MNIRSVGPILYLASQATTKDGRLDFVCVREEDRSLCMEYLDARLAGRRAKFPLPLLRFRELKNVWENSMLHFDDKVWPRKSKRRRVRARSKYSMQRERSSSRTQTKSKRPS